MLDEAKHYREQLIEKVSEVDDKILEKYLHGQEIPEDEIKAALRKRTIESVRDEKTRVRAGRSADRRSRTRACSRCSTPSSTTCRRRSRFPAMIGHRSERRRRRARPSGRRPTTRRSPALAFKIMTDPFVGQLTFIRVYSGVMTSGMAGLQRRRSRRPSASAAC